MITKTKVEMKPGFCPEPKIVGADGKPVTAEIAGYLERNQAHLEQIIIENVHALARARAVAASPTATAEDKARAKQMATALSIGFWQIIGPAINTSSIKAHLWDNVFKVHFPLLQSQCVTYSVFGFIY